MPAIPLRLPVAHIEPPQPEVEPWPSQPSAAPYDDWTPKLRNAASIIAEVAKKYQLPTGVLVGRSRSRKVVGARHEAAFRIIIELGYSYPKTGRMLGGRDHTTALHSLRQHAKSSPEAAELYRNHVECVDGIRATKRAEALVMYFDVGLPPWKIAAKLHISAGAVNRWLLEETERRHRNNPSVEVIPSIHKTP